MADYILKGQVGGYEISPYIGFELATPIWTVTSCQLTPFLGGIRELLTLPDIAAGHKNVRFDDINKANTSTVAVPIPDANQY